VLIKLESEKHPEKTDSYSKRQFSRNESKGLCKNMHEQISLTSFSLLQLWHMACLELKCKDPNESKFQGKPHRQLRELIQLQTLQQKKKEYRRMRFG